MSARTSSAGQCRIRAASLCRAILRMPACAVVMRGSPTIRGSPNTVSPTGQVSYAIRAHATKPDTEVRGYRGYPTGGLVPGIRALHVPAAAGLDRRILAKHVAGALV